MVLLPLTLAGTAPQAWKTPWIAALIAVGGVLLIALPFYEKYVAVHPIIPLHVRTIPRLCLMNLESLIIKLVLGVDQNPDLGLL